MKIIIKDKPTSIQYEAGKIYQMGKEYFMLIKIGNDRTNYKYGFLNLNFGDVEFLYNSIEEMVSFYNNAILVDTELIIKK